MIEKKKKSRARGPDKKAKQFNKIIEMGKDLFIKYGSQGFGLKELANKLNMVKSNIYNYVRSKRELWYAIRLQYFSEYEKGLADLLKNHKGNYVEFGIKWAQYFLEFAAADYKRFEMMFFIRAPSSNKIGPYEKKYRPLRLMEKGLNIVNKAISEGKYRETDPIPLYYTMYASCLGAAKIEADLKLNYKITEPLTIEKNMLSSEEFRSFFLKEFRDRLEKAYKS
ncbi:MAG: TetR/AcrR family transcriptional regulator [Promethearchaeota archaeon]